jgi:hypothetical protein
MSHLPHSLPSDPQPGVVSVPRQGPALPRTRGELFLESLQERVYAAVGVTAEDCQQREWLGQQTILPVRLRQKAEQLSPSEFAKYRTAVLDALTRDELTPRPTPFERPHQYSILRGLKTSIEAAAVELSIGLPFTPVIGTLPTRLLEPLMVRVPGSDEVVLVIDGSLLTYVHLLAKAVAHALPFDILEHDPDVPLPLLPGWEHEIDPDGEATQRFVELMMAAISGNTASAPVYAPDPGSEQTVASLCECMELFIVAREYARLAEAEHLAAGAEQRSAHGETFEALVWTARQELHADALGLALMLSAADDKGESPRVAFWSADILLASFAVMDRALMAFESPGAMPLVSVPPTIFDERRTRLHALMNHINGGARAAAFATALAPVTTTLAERFDIVLQDLRHGPRPSH